MQPHFLQSQPWEKYQQLEGHQTTRLHTADFDALVLIESTPVGKYLYCPYGPTLAHTETRASALNSLKSALAALKDLATEHHAFFIRIEPVFPFSHSDLNSLHLRKSHDLDPAHTWVLDLTQSEEAIFKEMEKEKGRLWRNHHKKDITLRHTQNPEEIHILFTLLQGVAKKDHFNPQDEAHLRNQLASGFATLYIAELASEPIAASLVYDHDGVRYYAHAAADDTHRKLAAGSILLVEMIVDAKRSGSKSFDFWGITTSEDPNHPWYGFTKFKKTFGGQQVDYAGTWDLPLNNFHYQIYNFIRHLNRIKRKLLK